MKWQQLDDGNFQAEGKNGIFLVFIIGAESHAEYFPIGNQKSVVIIRHSKSVLQAQRACENSLYWEKADYKGAPRENRNKLHAEKTEVDGIMFDSRKEARRYSELKLLEKAGKIKNLERQKEYLLIPAQRDKDGKVIERAVKYIADFVYLNEKGRLVVEDVKGYQNPATAAYGKYVIKRKLMLYQYGIRIQEI